MFVLFIPEAFSPTYSGFYDRVVRLHRCYHTLRLHAYRLQKCASYLNWLCLFSPFQSYTASSNQGTCRREVKFGPAAYTFYVLGRE